MRQRAFGWMWSGWVGLGLGAAVLLPPASASAQSKVEPQPPAHLPTLVSRGGRDNLGARIEGTEVLLYGCGLECRGNEVVATRMQLPGRFEFVDMLSQVWELSTGERLLQMYLAPAGDRKGRAYSVLVRGGRGKEPPRVLLKGYLDEASGTGLELLGEGRNKQLVLTKRRVGGACGGHAFAEVRRFDPERGEFVPARRPPFDDATRAKAVERKLETAAAGAGELHVPPTPTPTSGAQLELLPRLQPREATAARLTDGDQETIWQEPWGQAGFELPAGANRLRITVTESATATKGRWLWLQLDGQLLHVQVPTAAGRYELPLLGEQPTCAVLVNDAQPTGVTEVRAFARYTDDPSTPALLRALEGEQGALVARALAARGNEGPRAVADAYVGYGALGRRRALELSASLPDESGTPIELQALAQGDAAQRARAEEQLLARGAGALPGLLAALGVAAETAPSTNAPSTPAPATPVPSTPAPSTTVPVTAAPPTPAAELAWLRLLARLQPERVVAVTLPRLDRPSARQRAELRTLIGELAGQAVHQPELRSAFADTQRPRRVRVELLRALGTSQGEESSRFEPELSTAFLQLAETPSFAEQYVLVDVALRLRERPEARERLRVLWRELPGDWSAAQRDAYLTRLLEGWSEALLPSDAAFGPWVDTVAKSGGVRVRKMAAAWLGRSVVAAPSLAGLARQDAWPLVREEAVRALGERAGTSGAGSAGASGAAEEAIVIAALAEDASEGVRRSAARSLRRFGNEASVKALRDALDGDAAWLVRADAATSLGRRCDRESLERLAELAHGLTAPQPEGEVDLSLASLGALVALAPPDLEARLAPLRADSIPGPLKGQIERAVAEASRHTCGAKR